jgi:DNA invertase Pin-like site-specific DNA recombinase
MTEPSRAVLYARVSTTRQDVEGQLADLRRVAVMRSWSIVEEYSDVISGAATKRPGLDRLMEDARRHRFDVVLTWRLDRLGRSLIHLVRVVDELLGFGIAVVSATEPHMDSTTPAGRLLRNIFASVAEYERELIRERVRAGVRRSRARRRHWGRPPEHVVDVVHVQTLLARGLSVRAVARELGLYPIQVRRALKRAEQNPTLSPPAKPAK